MVNLEDYTLQEIDNDLDLQILRYKKQRRNELD